MANFNDKKYIALWEQFCSEKGIKGGYISDQEEEKIMLIIDDNDKNFMNIVDNSVGLFVKFGFGDLVNENNAVNLFVEFTTKYLKPNTPVNKLHYRLQNLFREHRFKYSYEDKTIRAIHYHHYQRGDFDGRELIISLRNAKVCSIPKEGIDGGVLSNALDIVKEYIKEVKNGKEE